MTKYMIILLGLILGCANGNKLNSRTVSSEKINIRSTDKLGKPFNNASSTIAPYNCIVDHRWLEKPPVTLHYSDGPKDYPYKEQWVLDDSYGNQALTDYAKTRGLSQEETWLICQKMARDLLINNFITYNNSSSLLKRTEPIPLPSESNVLLTDKKGNILKRCNLEPTEKFNNIRNMQFSSDTAFLHKYQSMIGSWWKTESPDKVKAWEKFLKSAKRKNPWQEGDNKNYYERELHSIFKGLGPVEELEKSLVKVVCEKAVK